MHFFVHDGIKVRCLFNSSTRGCLVEEILSTPLANDVVKYIMRVWQLWHISRIPNTMEKPFVRGKVILQHISSNKMVANPLTKATTRNVFQTHVKSLGLCRISGTFMATRIRFIWCSSVTSTIEWELYQNIHFSYSLCHIQPIMGVTEWIHALSLCEP